jgi:transcriptional regulator with XRE-family HTH domain
MWADLAEITDPGDSIRERRIELGWTQATLSKLTGIPQAEISRIENGRIDARWSTIRRLFEALANDAQPRRRTRANGGSVSSPATPGTRWSAKGATAPIIRKRA